MADVGHPLLVHDMKTAGFTAMLGGAAVAIAAQPDASTHYALSNLADAEMSRFRAVNASHISAEIALQRALLALGVIPRG